MVTVSWALRSALRNAIPVISFKSQKNCPAISAFPKFIWPEDAVITAYVNDEEVFSEKMTITPHPSEKGQHRASIENYYFDLTLQEGDSLKVVLLVTDNLGRTEDFVEGGTVKDGRLERGGVTTPVITVD